MHDGWRNRSPADRVERQVAGEPGPTIAFRRQFQCNPVSKAREAHVIVADIDVGGACEDRLLVDFARGGEVGLDTVAIS